MIRRLLMTLLIGCLAVPALAAPLHCQSAPRATAAMDHGEHGRDQGQQPDTAQHDCIGCIVQRSELAGPERQAIFPPASYTVREALMLAPLTSGPDTPPPRS